MENLEKSLLAVARRRWPSLEPGMFYVALTNALANATTLEVFHDLLIEGIESQFEEMEWVRHIAESEGLTFSDIRSMYESAVTQNAHRLQSTDPFEPKALSPKELRKWFKRHAQLLKRGTPRKAV